MISSAMRYSTSPAERRGCRVVPTEQAQSYEDRLGDDQAAGAQYTLEQAQGAAIDATELSQVTGGPSACPSAVPLLTIHRSSPADASRRTCVR